MLLFVAITELWADARARAYARANVAPPVKGNCTDCDFKALPSRKQCSVHFAKPGAEPVDENAIAAPLISWTPQQPLSPDSRPVILFTDENVAATPTVNRVENPAAIPCRALSPDSRLRCDLEAGHTSWHSCDGSLWYGDNWNVDEFADTQQRPVTQDDTMPAADWAASNPKKVIGPKPLEFNIGLFGCRRPRRKTRNPQVVTKTVTFDERDEILFRPKSTAATTPSEPSQTATKQAQQQENTVSATDWSASNPGSNTSPAGRATLTDRVFVGTWRSPMMGGCEISEQQRHRIEWLEEAA
jgi:hypothetical protein